ncbi:asialoglycoprotein receptor 1-like [Xyrichtys novacula]|uniref:Asialoglycoprotein receptor 1-like n=1 Tax=Xyrichtys novacula TaxID=13765 RepID=A0AAV1FPI3_XYRNO|nr:asialoglycoprotein receptor 1-like [Xyrichtys novacula]
MKFSWSARHAECDDDYVNNTTTNLTTMSEDQIRELILERDELLLERVWLFQEKREKEAEIINLLRDSLSDRNNELENTIEELQSKVFPTELRPSCCPRGWQPYMSSCYRSSSDKGTWDDAQQDCEKLRAHLVVLDDAMEERVVHKFSTGMGMWIGLRKLKDPKTSTWDWTWVNGSPLAYTNWNQTYDGFWSFLFFNRNCAASPESSLTPAPWDRVNCENQNYWMCEKELNFSSFSP